MNNLHLYNTITTALQQLIDWKIDLTNTSRLPAILKDLKLDKPDRLLLETAFVDMKAYELLQKARANNAFYAVDKLTEEMHKRYRTDKEVANIIIERIAVMLAGFPEQTKPAQSPPPDPPVPVQPPPPIAGYCTKCKTPYTKQDVFCSKCRSTLSPYSNKNTNIAMILWLLLGWTGGHRFYLGKRKTGILHTILAIIILFIIFSIGGVTKFNVDSIFFAYLLFLSILTLNILCTIDSFRISHGKFSDSRNKKLKPSNKGWRTFNYIMLIPNLGLDSLIIWLLIEMRSW